MPPEILGQEISGTYTEFGSLLLLGRLLLALALGLVIAAVYLISQNKGRSESLPLLTTLVLLTVLIAVVTQVIGDNVARAFSLVGALSIVRFRTVVEDTRDTAFVIFAVVVGMAVGADRPRVALVGIPVVSLAALSLSWWGNQGMARAHETILTLRLGLGHDLQGTLTEVFARHGQRHRLISTSTARQGAALDQVFSLQLKDPQGMLALVQELNRIEGIQSVEAREKL